MLYALPAVQFGKLHTSNLLKIKSNASKISKGDYENKCRLNVSHIKLKSWVQNIIYKNTINTPSSSATIYSDTCPTGWGATCSNLSTGGNWSIAESETHKLFRNVSCFVGHKTLLQGLARFNSLV